MNYLEQTGTSYKEELDTLLAPNFQSVETTVPQVWWNRKFPTVKLAQFNLRDVPA